MKFDLKIVPLPRHRAGPELPARSGVKAVACEMAPLLVETERTSGNCLELCLFFHLSHAMWSKLLDFQEGQFQE